MEFGPIAPIVGAMVGALIAAAVTYFVVVKRKRVTFWIRETEDLTAPLRKHHPDISIKIGNNEYKNMNKGSVLIRNMGNQAVENFAFDVALPGRHGVIMTNLKWRDPTATMDQLGVELVTDSNNMPLRFSIPFLNPNESLELDLYFEGEPVGCNVSCRMQDLKIKMRRGGTFTENVLNAKAPDLESAAILAMLQSVIRVIAKWRY
jgi:hypothetical protein